MNAARALNSERLKQLARTRRPGYREPDRTTTWGRDELEAQEAAAPTFLLDDTNELREQSVSKREAQAQAVLELDDLIRAFEQPGNELTPPVRELVGSQSTRDGVAGRIAHRTELVVSSAGNKHK